MVDDEGKGGQCSSVSSSSSLSAKSTRNSAREAGPVYSMTPSTGGDVNAQLEGRDDVAMTSQAPQCACAVAVNSAERGPVRKFKVFSSTETKSRHHKISYSAETVH